MNEFFNNNQLTFHDKNYRFIQKIMRYDDDVDEIVTNDFFLGFRFEDPDMDKWFKRAWLNHFSSWQIDFQTIERFAQENIAVTLMHEKEMNALYTKFELMLANTNHQSTRGQAQGTNQTRDINSTLPQDKLNLDFDDFHMDYADDNQIGKSQKQESNESTTEATSFNPSTFKMLMHLWDGYFQEYEDRCFMKIW